MNPKILELIEQLPDGERASLLQVALEYQDALKREQGQEKFLSFVKSMWPGFISGRHHAVMAKKFEEIAAGKLKRLIINCPPRHAIMVGMKIPTMQGFKTMADLRVGDFVFGPDGKPTEVLAKSGVFKGRELYRVTTDDGASLVVDGEHLWTVRLDRKSKNWKDYTTEELWLRQEGWVFRDHSYGKTKFFKGKSKDFRAPMLPEVKPVEYQEKSLPIDPYVLGVWLGDGSKNQATISKPEHDAKIMRRLIEERGFKTSDRNTECTFGIFELKAKLQDAGLLGNKHIPREYLEASPSQRRELLKGLMDTDGNVSKEGQCFFSQSNREFIESVAQLVRSLGIKASILESEAKIKDKSYGPAWKLSFYATDISNIARKEDRTLKGERKFGRYIKVEKLEETGDTQCIKVNREDGLFLAGEGYICTHNTKSEFASFLLPAWFLGKFPNKKVIQTSHTAELAVGFGRKVRNLVDSEAYAKIFPNVALRQDSKAAGRWSTNAAGEYFAIGVGGAVTGKGADLLIIDDPHALEINTPIATPNGFVSIKDLNVGDYVYGPDGEPTKVISKSPVYNDRELFEVKTYDGEVIFADAKHLWSVRTSTRVADPYRTITTDELVKARSSAFMIPRHKAVQYPVRELPIDPWVLGAWLGDGTSSIGRMTAHPDDAIFMRGEFKRRGYKTKDLADKFSFSVEGLWTQLKSIGVLNNKHIPEEYMTASFLQRMDLLCGLMDTDGNVTTSGQCAFHNKNAKLVDQVVELLHSLGRKCQRRTYSTNGKFGYCVMHRVTFKLKDCALMPRKRIRTRTTHDKQHRSITVKKTDLKGDVQCITVDRADGLFLAGRGYVVTHNSEQEATLAETSPEIYDKTYEWFTSGPRQRLQPGGAIVVVQTRWSKRDLTGQVLKASAQREGDEWEVIEFPAILPSGKPLWPEFWPLEELEALRNELPNSKWQAQYQQSPTSESAAIIKRDWWKVWEEDDPPTCEYTLMAWDTAFEANNRADYSACTLWGIFDHPDENGVNQTNIILLNAFRDRMEFPELKRRAVENWKEWQPDSVIIEKKASGAPLIYELRAMGIPVQEFTPVRGNDKITRLNAISDIFASGRVWAPPKRWAEEVVDEVASFPSGEYDDYVDTVSLALMRFRKGGFIRTLLDEEDEIIRKRSYAYY